MEGEYLTTWAIQDGHVRRKNDYLAINAIYRNTATTAQSNTNWNSPTETGAVAIKIRYRRTMNIPRKAHASAQMTRRSSNAWREKTTEKEEPTQEWATFKTKLGRGVHEVYPIRKKQTNPTEPEWVTRLGEWGTETEIRQIACTYKNRTAIQQEIDRRIAKLLLQARQLKLQKMMKSRKRPKDTPDITKTG